MQTCTIQSFEIDAVVYAGPAEEERKVYLSAATLLILPPTLISHWLHQIRVHLKPNTLRVAVLDRGSGDDAAAGKATRKQDIQNQ